MMTDSLINPPPRPSSKGSCFAGWRWFVLFLSLAVVARAAEAPADADAGGASFPLSSGVQRQELHYRAEGGAATRAVVYARAERPRPSAAIVFFPGGGWRHTDLNQFARQADRLASLGMVAICIDYRTASRDGATPVEAIEDAKSAIRWVRSQANALGIDPHRLVAAGGSTGGHLAAACATIDDINFRGEATAGDAHPDALVLFNPVIDNSPSGYAYKPLGDEWRRISPLHHLRVGLPPAVLFIGDADTVVPIASAREFARQWHDLGGELELDVYPRAKHGFFNYRAGQEAVCADTLAKTEAFLTRHGFLAASSAEASDVTPGGPFFADGAKAGDVTQTSAIVWARLTRHPERNVHGLAFPKIDPKDIPTADIDPSKTPYERNAIIVSLPVPEAAQLQGHQLDEMEGATPGSEGDVRIVYWRADEPKQTATTTRAHVTGDTDFTHSFALTGLAANTVYRFRVEAFASWAQQPTANFDGGFKTAPRPEQTERISFTVITCQDYARRDDPLNGHKIYASMKQLDPDFFVHTGDLEYLDKPSPLATNVELARFKFDRILALPFQRDFYSHHSGYFMKDDHDTLKDDAWPGQTYGDLTFAQGQAVYREHVPLGEKPYRTIRWGKDLQIWLVEGRDYRSPNDAPESPEKTILGVEQKRWFKETVQASDATFRILISPTPIFGPDREGKGDSHANAAFAHEGAELRKFVASQKNMFVLCGDRHWQYASIDPVTGMREYGSGPSSDSHAGGFSEADRSPAHTYLKIKGGFLSVIIERVNGRPRAIVRHYSVDGQINHEDVIEAK